MRKCPCCNRNRRAERPVGRAASRQCRSARRSPPPHAAGRRPRPSRSSECGGAAVRCRPASAGRDSHGRRPARRAGFPTRAKPSDGRSSSPRSRPKRPLRSAPGHRTSHRGRRRAYGCSTSAVPRETARGIRSTRSRGRRTSRTSADRRSPSPKPGRRSAGPSARSAPAIPWRTCRRPGW